jgi:hypothetical protein
MEWSPNEIKIFLDGALYFTATPSNLGSHTWRFDKRFYILLNLAIGGAWAGSPDGTTTFPQTMEVDYVRVYQKIADMEVKGVTLTEPNANSVTYSVPSLSGMTYQWSVSGAGNSIASGQNTNQITVNWGSTSGTVSVLVHDGCAADATLNLNVTVSPNLWTNYGFEQNYVSWDARPAYSSNLSFGIATTGAAEGSKAACVDVLNNVTPAAPWNMQLSRTNLSLTAGTSYTLQFKAKSDAARPISASFITSTFNTIGSSYRYITLTTGWQQYSITFTPSSSVTGAMFNVDLARELGTYCFDDFVFARTTLLPVINLENQSNICTIYPNPAKDGNFKVHLMLQEMQLVNVLVFNSLGQKVWFDTTVPQVGNIEIPVQLPQVAKGFYTVEINANGKIATQRILIE